MGWDLKPQQPFDIEYMIKLWQVHIVLYTYVCNILKMGPWAYMTALVKHKRSLRCVPIFLFANYNSYHL